MTCPPCTHACEEGKTCDRADEPLFAPESCEGWAWFFELLLIALTVFCAAMVVWRAVQS